MSARTLPRLHPLTGAPLRPLGYRKDGRAIWPILGGAEGDGDGDQGDGDGDGDQGGDDQQQDQQPDSPWNDPAKAKAEIERLRRENGSARTTAKQQAADEARTAMAQEIGKALGLIKDDEATDPAKLTEQLTASQAEIRVTKVENAVLRSAGKHGADPEALTDSRSFLAKLGSLDPAAEDFTTQVDTAIKAAVDSNPKLKTGRAPGASGADHTGGSGEAHNPAANARPGVDRIRAAYDSATA